MDPFDKHPAASTSLAEREQQFTDLAAEVVDTEAITEAAFGPAVSTWEGIAAPELRAAPGPARDQAYQVASELTWAATATKVWAEHVGAFNAKVDGLHAERALVPVEVERYLASSPWASLPIFDQDAVRERKRSELIEGLHRRWGDAYEEHVEAGSREVAGMLNRGPTWESLQAARQLGVLTGAAPLVRFFTAGWEALAGPAEALRLAGLFNDPDHHTTDEEIEQLHELLDHFAGDEAFWFQFLTGLGPEGLLNLNGAVALHVPSELLGMGPANPDLAGVIGDIQSMLGAGLALTSTRRGGSTAHGAAPPGEFELPPEWLVALIDAGRQTYEVGMIRAGNPMAVELYGYQLLGPLLNVGAYDDRFLQLVGGDMIDFEMEQGGARLWGDWVGDRVIFASATRLDWTGGWDIDRPAGFDPVTGLVSAMDRNPEGALGMLAGRTQTGAGAWADGSPKPLAPPPGGDRMPRLDYLLTDRDWPPGWFDLHRSLDYLESNPGAQFATPAVAQFGEVLEQVARLDDPRAVAVVELIVYEINTDEQAMGYVNGTVPGEPWHQTDSNLENDIINPVLRDSLANIMSDYIIDVNAAVLDSGASMPGGLDAEFDATHMIRFLADLGKDQSAHDTVLGGQAAYAAAGYHFYLSGEADLQPDGQRERLVAAEGVAQSYGAVSGALDVGAATANWYAQWQEDLAHNTRVADSLTIAEIVVGSVADLASLKAPGAGYAAGELSKVGLESIGEALMVDHSGRSVYQNAMLFGDSRQLAVDLAEAALYRSGQLEGLGDYHLLDSDGQPKPMSQWEDEDRNSWRDYKQRTGQATAGALLDQTGAAYQRGLDNAERTMLGAVRDGS